ncbi:hypothetical protein ASG40_19410 [Methylobacterium sp. Leaf399]|uniref:hypothetical protein n=1 Tax=Methylobacterium sp. Leaf399 TaxID=1736364 RepID=UPI0006F74C76|nr:hypothetical protein [Methylobacterium sp. Leaf399]KQT13996.1 hypothetical protein ASG40_19410 [Methylobacterium sp. Leaf399]
MTIYTVELQAHDGSGVVSLYAASDRYNTGPTDTPADKHFSPRLKEPASFERALFSGGAGQGTPTVGFGEIVIINADGVLDAWADYAFDGRPCVVKAVEPGGTYASAMVLVRGRIESVDVTDVFRTIRLRLYDPLIDLDRPLLTTAYAGTTNAAGQGAEGTSDLAATLKPRIYGVVWNIAPTNVNPFELIYQASDRPAFSIIAYDGGLALTNAGDTATLAALTAATIPAGSYRTCLALGLIRLGGTPARAVTADVVAGAAAANRSSARIVQAMLADAGVPAGSIDTASFDALHTAAPAINGIRVQGDVTVMTAIGQVLRGVGAWIITTAQGLYQVGRFTGPTTMPVASFANWQLRGDVERLATGSDDTGIPTWRVVVRYRPIGVVQGEGDLVGAVSAARRAANAQQWREAVAENPATKARWLTARVLTVETGLANLVEAQAEANRLLALFSVKRALWRIRVDSRFAIGVELGETVSLTLPRHLLTGGNLVVTGRVDDASANRVQLDLWG